MWGIIIAIILYAVGILVIVGKEGIRETKSNTEWTEEELAKMQGASVMGWRLLAILLIIMGAGVLYYSHMTAIPGEKNLEKVTGIATTVEKNHGTGDVRILLSTDEKEYVLSNAISRKLDLNQVEAIKEQEINIGYMEKKELFSKKEAYQIYVLQCDGKEILSYEMAKGNADQMAGVWKELSMFFFAAAVITILILLYAHINPKVYKIICIYKPEKGIKPTVGQRLEQEIGGIWENSFKSKITTSTSEKMQEKLDEQTNHGSESAKILVEMDETTYREYLEFLRFREILKQDNNNIESH